MDPPEGMVPIGCNWVYKRKIGSTSEMETYKARLVVKGYIQKEGVKCDEIFLPIGMIKYICIFLVITTHLDYEIW